MPNIQCPACGETDDLDGARAVDGTITVTCGSCAAVWPRDTTTRCATCGSDDLSWRPQALTAFSRGTQLSILGLHRVPLCMGCDGEAFRTSADSGSALPADFRPAALHPPAEAPAD